MLDFHQHLFQFKYLDWLDVFLLLLNLHQGGVLLRNVCIKK